MVREENGVTYVSYDEEDRIEKLLKELLVEWEKQNRRNGEFIEGFNSNFKDSPKGTYEIKIIEKVPKEQRIRVKG